MKWQLVLLFPRERRRLSEWRSRLLQQAAGRRRFSLTRTQSRMSLLIVAERNRESEV